MNRKTNNLLITLQPYNIMFGPDWCGGTRKTHVIFNYNGTNHLVKREIPPMTDEISHLYTLIVKPDRVSIWLFFFLLVVITLLTYSFSLLSSFSYLYPSSLLSLAFARFDYIARFRSLNLDLPRSHRQRRKSQRRSHRWLWLPRPQKNQGPRSQKTRRLGRTWIHSRPWRHQTRRLGRYSRIHPWPWRH